MVLKGVNWIHNGKFRSYDLERSQLGTQSRIGSNVSNESTVYTMVKSVHMVLKESIGYTMEMSGHMVLKGVDWLHNPKIRSNSLQRSQTIYIMVN